MITPQETIADVAAVAAHYDDLDLFYRTIWGTHVHHGYWKTGKENREEAVLKLTRLVAEQVGIQAGDRVCDMGCGYGATAMVLAREYKAKVTALTVSQKTIRVRQIKKLPTRLISISSSATPSIIS